MNRMLIVASLVASLAGCNVADPSGGTDTGNGLAMGLTAVQTAADAQGTTFEVETARAYVQDIDLLLPGGVDCSAIDPHPQARCNSAHYIIEGPFEIDLVTREATPPIEAPIPVGTYKRVDVRFVDGALLQDRTLVASGTFDNAGTPTGFDLALRFNATAMFESADGVVVDPDTELLGLLDVASWLTAVPVTDCLQAGDLELSDGRLPLADGRGQCSGVENDIIDAVKKSGRLDRSE